MELSIGIDVSKAKLDICLNKKVIEIENNKKSIEKFFLSVPKASHIVMESTGKYHRLAHRTLSDYGFSVNVINPYQSKHFAKALNLICKTDAVDAKMLALYAEKMDIKVSRCPTESEHLLLDLSRHLDDLKQTLQDLNNRYRESEGFIKKSLNRSIKAIEKEIASTEKQLLDHVKNDNTLSVKIDLLTTIPGIGVTTAISLLSYVRELGHINKREVAAISGLAPINNDSGKFNGKRRIGGGRRDVRSHLYMPIVGAATQHNEELKTFYNRLVGNGKAKKVALTACMRKLVVWANAILASGEPWKNNAN